MCQQYKYYILKQHNADYVVLGEPDEYGIFESFNAKFGNKNVDYETAGGKKRH